MNPDRLCPEERTRKAHPLLLLLVLSLCLLFPQFSSGQELQVSFEEITPIDEGGATKTEFFPGEKIRVRVRLRVLQATGNPFVVRLRISGDGWHEILPSEPVLGPGVHWMVFSETESEDDLRVPPTAGKGKVNLLMDAFSTQDTVGLQGRRHGFLEIGCPEGVPAGGMDRFTVGGFPRDMALTPDGRYLYVTSTDAPRVTVIDVETKEVVPTELEDSEGIVMPAGVAAHPSEPVMYIADSELRVLHVVNAETHMLQESIVLNPTGDLDVTYPGDVAVNLAGTEVYVADTSFPTVLVVQLNPPAVRALSLSAFPAPPAGLLPVQVMTDPDSPDSIYVLCAWQNEIIKLDVVSGAILAFVRLRNLLDPTTLWPVWSMALNPERDEIYVVVNPDDFDLNPLTFRSNIFTLDRRTLARKEELLLEGLSIWELVVREDGRFVYAIDSRRGEVLVIDMDTGTEMSRCAIPVEPGGVYFGQTLRKTASSWRDGWPDSSTSWSEAADPLDQGGSGNALHVSNRSDPAPRSLDDLPSDDPVDRPVRSLHQHIRPETLDHGNRGVLVKRNHEVDALEGCQDLGSILFRLHRTRRPLQSTNRFVAVYAHHEEVAHPSCLLKVANVPDVQEVKTPVREDDAGALRPVGDEFCAEVFQGPELLAHPDAHS